MHRCSNWLSLRHRSNWLSLRHRLETRSNPRLKKNQNFLFYFFAKN